MAAVALSQRVSLRSEGSGDLDSVLASPPANRSNRSRWRDPRLWLGALLVMASVVIGARVLAAADDTVVVRTVNRTLSAGMAITPADVGVARVHFSSATDAARYWAADDPLPAQAHLTRDVGAGELLTRSAVSGDASTVPHQLPLDVTAAGLPANVAPGDHVEVWAVPKPEEPRSHPQLVLSDAAVLSVAGTTVAGLGSDRQVVVSLSNPADTAAVLDAINGATVVLVRISG